MVFLSCHMWGKEAGNAKIVPSTHSHSLVKWTHSCVLEKEGHSGEGQTAKDWWEVEGKPEGRALGSRLETQWSRQREMRG